ncbi:Hypothetical protein MAB_2350c [Mycobacteroides abscessus ATCC 19977]|uniref:Uncharacterized protein n=1 Tax=Mycobacteroides abscessus (strain ATCC 19977 / DSM 44196 / CCUG 20993 / CIP 104536 / JCM 13569 / NCTC 13031 / TMC 1543 / L948) TaxID=561007 RepID=B1MB10_MYCA9|nr:Hypothetical protein MAB_2350c [Mycobacteroides abscessus ATCC 19977]
MRCQASRREALVLFVGHLAGLVRQQYRDRVLDPIGPAQAGVVKDAVGIASDEQERPTIDRADQDV